jgi:hypothetical protein
VWSIDAIVWRFRRCPRRYFLTELPVAEALIGEKGVAALGEVEPPANVFPIEYCGIGLDSRQVDASHRAQVRSPGFLYLYEACARVIRNSEEDSYVEFSLLCHPAKKIWWIWVRHCPELIVEIGALGRINTTLMFGPAARLPELDWADSQWTSAGWVRDEGDDPWTPWRRSVGRYIPAGQMIGEAITYPLQGPCTMKIGVFDYRQGHRNAPASEETWTTYVGEDEWEDDRYLHAFPMLDYYSQGSAKTILKERLNREASAGDPHPYGIVMQDKEGTAHGCWFNPDHPDIRPENPHLALVYHPEYPSKRLFSVGESLEPGLPYGTYAFTPNQTGEINLDFADVVPGTLYLYEVNPYGVPNTEFKFLLKMTDAEHLQIQGFQGAGGPDAGTPTTWQQRFNHPVEFER